MTPRKKRLVFFYSLILSLIFFGLSFLTYFIFFEFDIKLPWQSDYTQIYNSRNKRASEIEEMNLEFTKSSSRLMENLSTEERITVLEGLETEISEIINQYNELIELDLQLIEIAPNDELLSRSYDLEIKDRTELKLSENYLSTIEKKLILIAFTQKKNLNGTCHDNIDYAADNLTITNKLVECKTLVNEMLTDAQALESELPKTYELTTWINEFYSVSIELYTFIEKRDAASANAKQQQLAGIEQNILRLEQEAQAEQTEWVKKPL